MCVSRFGFRYAWGVFGRAYGGDVLGPSSLWGARGRAQYNYAAGAGHISLLRACGQDPPLLPSAGASPTGLLIDPCPEVRWGGLAVGFGGGLCLYSPLGKIFGSRPLYSIQLVLVRLYAGQTSCVSWPGEKKREDISQ